MSADLVDADCDDFVKDIAWWYLASAKGEDCKELVGCDGPVNHFVPHPQNHYPVVMLVLVEMFVEELVELPLPLEFLVR